MAAESVKGRGMAARTGTDPRFDPTALVGSNRLEVLARTLVEGFISGLHRSPYKGASVEFAEHRQYTFGDEIRHIDWHAFGKTDRYFVKEFEEETNLRAYILVDSSASMAYGGGKVTKFQYARLLACVLAYLLLRQRDAVGLAVVDSEVREYVPPSAAPQHFRLLSERLEGCVPEGETALAPLFDDLAEQFHRRGLVIILSDFFDDTEHLIKALQHFRFKRHDLICIHILDPDEIEFPFSRMTEFIHLESESERLILDPAAIRAQYLDRFQAFLDEFREGARQSDIDYVEVQTDTPYDRVLARFLFRRAERRRRRQLR